MKNIQIIDGAQNCTFSVFQATEDEFQLIFPMPGQDIEFAEDLIQRTEENSRALDMLWQRPIIKQNANGIHGTLFMNSKVSAIFFPRPSASVTGIVRH